MKIILARSPRYLHDGSIHLLVTFENMSELAYNATIDDSEAHGRELYDRAIRGEFGPIQPYVTPVATQTEIISKFTLLIQRYLDNFAKTRGYDNILSACTYATSKVPKFSVEGQYCIDMRDQAWSIAYGILDEVLNNTRSVPTFEELIEELPTLVWPA